MQLQEGIGRGGFRLLALVFAALGALGILTTLVAFNLAEEGLFKWIGFVLTSFAVLSLFILVMVTVAAPRVPAKPRSELMAEDLLDVEEALPEETGDESNPAMEYEDEPAPMPMGGPGQARTPIPRVQPAPKPFGQPRTVVKDTKGWPERRGPTGVTRGQTLAAEREARERPAPQPVEKEAPLVMARTAASAEAAGLPDNVTVGKCGNCSVLLLAPKKRPIRLQCPRCERVHTLA